METPESRKERPHTFAEYKAATPKLRDTGEIERFYLDHLAICNAVLARIEIGLQKPHSPAELEESLRRDITVLTEQLHSMKEIQLYLIEQYNALPDASVTHRTPRL